MAGYAASLIIKCSLHQALFKGLITAYCKTIYSGMQAAELLRIMGSIGINVSPAANAENELADALELHDLLRAGVV